VLEVINTTSTTSTNIGIGIYAPNIPSSSSQNVIYGGKSLTNLNGFGIDWYHTADGSTGNSAGINLNGVNNLIRFWGSGNVTINSAADAGLKLDVNGTARTGTVTTSNGSSVNTLTISKSGYSWGLTAGINGQNGFGIEDITSGLTGASAPFFIGPASGNVGIGTITPNDKLHVIGSGRITGNTLFSTGTATAIIGSTGDSSYKLSVDGDLRLYGKIRTDTPTGGIGPGVWKLGAKRTGSVSLDTGNYVEVEIDGALYRLALVTLN
jgi:hypothetical protein